MPVVCVNETVTPGPNHDVANQHHDTWVRTITLPGRMPGTQGRVVRNVAGLHRGVAPSSVQFSSAHRFNHYRAARCVQGGGNQFAKQLQRMVRMAHGTAWHGAWHGMAWHGMAEVCEGAPVAVSGWVLTDRHDPAPCAANSLHRETMSVNDMIGGTGTLGTA